MKKTVRTIAIYIFAAVLAVFCLFTVSAQSFLYARADSALSYDKTNVLDDLEGATIEGEPFNLSDYAPNAYTKTDVILFSEYCYGYYSNTRSNYGLYMYVWNPQLIGYNLRSELNQIEFTTTEGGSYAKYPLEYLNMSNEPGYEGVLYKFKVVLTSAQKENIFATFSGKSERYYHVSGIELLINGDTNATEYNVNKEYIYSGYAAGYGPDSEAESSLTCRVDKFGTTLSLDVKSTYWRPEGTHSDGYTRDTLHSVYFAVPNDILAEYGNMTAVHARWLNAYTAPIFVTGNRDVYDALVPYLAKYVNGGSRTELIPNTSLEYALIATKAADEAIEDVTAAPYGGYYAFNHYTSSGLPGLPAGTYDNPIYYLNYLFYAENGNADDYTLSAEKLLGNKETGEKGWLETFTALYTASDSSPDYTTLVNGKYLSALFESVDDEFTDVTISSDDEYNLTDKTVSNSIWDKLFGHEIKVDTSYTISAIQKVTRSDLELYSNATTFCNEFYISESDYETFSDYVEAAESANKTVFLFRYYQSEYVSNEATEYMKDTEWSLFDGTTGTYKYVDTNAYFAQMWIQLDFDIIDLTFTKDNVSVVIPVVMSPIDIAADIEPPVNTHDDDVPWLTIALLLAVSIGGLIITRIIKSEIRKAQGGKV